MNIYAKMGLAMTMVFTASVAFAAAPDQAGDLATAVRTEIGKSEALRTDHLSVETVGGVVYVRGTVDTEVERASVRAAAAKAAGGAKVVDLTEIAY